MKKLYVLFIVLIFFFLSCNSSIVDDPSTVISFSTPRSAHVKLTVENSYNTVVDILINEQMPAGRHTVQFNASNLAEGLYYCIIEVRYDDGVDKIVKKLLLVK